MSHGGLHRSRTLRRRTVRAAALGAGAALALSLSAAPAGAAPGPGTAAQAQDLVEQAGRQLEALTEQLNDAQLTVAQQQDAAAAAARNAADAQAALAAMQPQVRAIAQSGYAGSTSSRMAAFLTSGSIDDLVQQMTTLDLIADHADTVLAGYAAAEAAAQQAQQAADAAAAQAQLTLSDLQAQKAQLQDQEQQYRTQYATLTATEQAAVDTALVGPELSAPAATPPAPTAAAGVAVRTALAQVGDMYQTGGSGPDTFDCSGLTMYAYAAAGVTLPHSSRSQSQLGVPVSRADLQPGDLVFFYSPVSHVGIYIGNGMMVHASVTGRPVAVTGVDKPGYVGARRVTG